jgi:hypothetical protein
LTSSSDLTVAVTPVTAPIDAVDELARLSSELNRLVGAFAL